MCLSAQQTTVRAILQRNCVRCHGGTDQTSGGLDLSSEDGLRKVVVPGKPEESRLLHMVEAGKMPLGGPRLDVADVAVLRNWIQDGARVGANTVAAEAPARTRRTFWSLREPAKGKPPSDARNPVDAFVQAKLAEKGLTQAPRADHRTLIRRISFDLTGLPPGEDLYSLTWEQAVDRLLAAPEYGERWGRHWLDIVRFGETDGGEHNYERFHSWRYRDYVIRSFNEDKPYDRFIRDQLTGDLLQPGNPDMVAATGFLVAGPWDQVSAELNKDKVMAATARMDELDDMVTTTFATFQGMTVNCARCHDHKFDPIPTRDYYRLTSVFAGVGFGNRKVGTPEAEAAYERSVTPVKEALGRVRQELAKLEEPVRVPMLRAKYQEFERQREHESARMPLNAIWNRKRFEAVSARHWRLVITSHPDKAAWIKDLELRPAGVKVSKWEGEYKASDERPLIVTLPDTDQPVSEITWAGPLNVYRLEASSDGLHWRLVGSTLDHVNGVELELPAVSEDELRSGLTGEAREQRAALLAQRKKLEAELAAIPALPLVYAAKPKNLEKSYLLERGSVTRQKEEVTPGALSAVTHRAADFGFTAETPDADRRLALADWITDARNPLTARVIVNRVWQYHFGQGIVNTPSDFGVNGDRPSHPELLDWLAVSLRENGWSLKWLHRLILSSDTYQQSDRFDEKANSVDAGNRLLWRMPLRRMDAETLRDSILFVSGKLDREARGGPGFALQKKGSGGSYIYKALDNDGPEVWRRAVYRFVVRGGERVMLDSFDCPDPAVATPQRTLSNTPVQALTLLNNEFVIRQAGFVAERLRRAGGDPVERAYDLMFGRKPTEREKELGVRFLKSQPLAAYCRVLMNSNEFVYVP